LYLVRVEGRERERGGGTSLSSLLRRRRSDVTGSTNDDRPIERRRGGSASGEVTDERGEGGDAANVGGKAVEDRNDLLVLAVEELGEGEEETEGLRAGGHRAREKDGELSREEKG
jgi:hypothetical protein